MSTSRGLSGPPFSSEVMVPNLTFGIELEYVYISKLPANLRKRDNVKQMELAIEKVREALQQEMHAKCRSCKGDVSFMLNQGEWPDNDPEYTCWVVEYESVSPTGSELNKLPDPHSASDLYFSSGIEIKSPIFKFGQYMKVLESGSAHEHEISHEDEIRAVVDRLRARFTGFHSDQQRDDYLYPNPECSLHVHVGDGQKGFDLDIIQKLMCMGIVCERLIDQLHATHRINGTDCAIRPVIRPSIFAPEVSRMDDDVSNLPFSLRFLELAYRQRQLDHGLVEHKSWERGGEYPQSGFKVEPSIQQLCSSSDMDSWMDLVRYAPSPEALVQLYGEKPRRSTVNIRNLTEGLQPDEPRKPTVEFRQHLGTIQANPILCWVDVVVRFVWFCKSRSWGNLDSLLGASGPFRKANVTYQQLCKIIGWKKSTMEHYKNQVAGFYAKNLRHEEHQQATEASHDHFAKLALYNIDEQRKSLDPSHVAQRMEEKLMAGGYGQFPRSFLDALLRTYASEEEKCQITLGYRSAVQPKDEHEPRIFTAEQDRPSSSGSEKSFYSDASWLVENRDLLGTCHTTWSPKGLLTVYFLRPSSSV
jgi:hypothetical protein